MLLATAERPFLFAAKEGEEDEILSQVPEVAGAWFSIIRLFLGKSAGLFNLSKLLLLPAFAPDA